MSVVSDVAASPPQPDLDRPGGARAVAPSWSPVPLLTRLHFYAGVLVAPFLVVAAVTGLAFTLTPQLDAVVYHRELHAAQVGPAHLGAVTHSGAASRRKSRAR